MTACESPSDTGYTASCTRGSRIILHMPDSQGTNSRQEIRIQTSVTAYFGQQTNDVVRT